MTKKLIAAILAVMMIAVFAGCNMVIHNDELDSTTVIAEVNGEKVLKGDLMADYESYKSFYGLSDENENDPDKADSKNSLIDTLIDKRVSNIIISQKAKEMGVDTLSEEQEASLQEQMDYIHEYVRTSVESAVLSQAATDPSIDTEALTEQLMAQYELDYGISTGSYEEDVYASLLKENISAVLNEGLEITDAEIEEYYNENLAIQKESIEEDHTSYATYAAGIAVYTPELHYVKNLLIKLDTETEVDIAALEGEEAEAKKEEALAELKAKADDIYKRAQNGEDFDALIAEFGGDPAMNSEPYKTDGYEVFADKTTFDPIFTEAAMALENVGDICEPTYSEEYGYYILQLIDKVEEGPVALDDVYDRIKDTLYNEAANLTLNEKLEEWKAADGVKIYKNRF